MQVANIVMSNVDVPPDDSLYLTKHSQHMGSLKSALHNL